MRNVKIKGNKLLNADMISPDMVYATFDDGLCKQVMEDIANELYYGSRMLDLYEQYRSNMHISNISEMFDLMESLFYNYSVKKQDIMIKNRSLK